MGLVCIALTTGLLTFKFPGRNGISGSRLVVVERMKWSLLVEFWNSVTNFLVVGSLRRSTPLWRQHTLNLPHMHVGGVTTTMWVIQQFLWQEHRLYYLLFLSLLLIWHRTCPRSSVPSNMLPHVLYHHPFLHQTRLLLFAFKEVFIMTSVCIRPLMTLGPSLCSWMFFRPTGYVCHRLTLAEWLISFDFPERVLKLLTPADHQWILDRILPRNCCLSAGYAAFRPWLELTMGGGCTALDKLHEVRQETTPLLTTQGVRQETAHSPTTQGALAPTPGTSWAVHPETVRSTSLKRKFLDLKFDLAKRTKPEQEDNTRPHLASPEHRWLGLGLGFERTGLYNTTHSKSDDSLAHMARCPSGGLGWFIIEIESRCCLKVLVNLGCTFLVEASSPIFQQLAIFDTWISPEHHTHVRSTMLKP